MKRIDCCGAGFLSRPLQRATIVGLASQRGVELVV